MNERLVDVEENDIRVMPTVLVVDDVLDNTTQLMCAEVPPLETMLWVRKKTVGFCELLQSIENGFA